MHVLKRDFFSLFFMQTKKVEFAVSLTHLCVKASQSSVF